MLGDGNFVAQTDWTTRYLRNILPGLNTSTFRATDYKHVRHVIEVWCFEHNIFTTKHSMSGKLYANNIIFVWIAEFMFCVCSYLYYWLVDHRKRTLKSWTDATHNILPSTDTEYILHIILNVMTTTIIVVALWCISHVLQGGCLAYGADSLYLAL